MNSLAKVVIFLLVVVSAAADTGRSAAQDLSVEQALLQAREFLMADPARPDEAEHYLEWILETDPDNLSARELDLWRDYRFGSSFLLPFRTAERLRKARDILEADSTRQLAHLVAGLIRYSDFLDNYETVRFRSFSSPGRAVGVDDQITNAAPYLFDTEVETDGGEAGLSFRDPSTTGWRMDYTSLSDAAHRYADEAVHHLGAAFDSDATGLTAHRYLAEVLLRTEQLTEGASMASRIIETRPESAEGWLLRGMFRARTGDVSGADADFAAAFERVPEETRRAMTTPELFIDQRPGGDPTAQSEFWLESDPLWSTVENEVLVEHVARMVEADLLFADPETGLRGWNTDAGVVYVRYGPPLVTARYSSLTESYMLLHYGDRRFMFMMPGRSGSYTFYSPSATAFQGARSTIRQWESDQEIAAREVFREEPRRSSVLAGRRMDVSSVATLFGGVDPAIVTAWCLPDRSSEGSSGGDVDRVELYVLSERAERPSLVSEAAHPEFSESGPKDCSVHVLRARTESERARYSLEVLAGERIGTVRFETEATADGLMTMSDLMPATLVVETTESIESPDRSEAVRRGGHEIYPVGRATFERGSDLYLYFELYGTGTDRSGPVTARIQAALLPDESPDDLQTAEGGVLERLIGRAFARGASGPSDTVPVSVDFEEQISSERVNRYLILRTDELDPGRYVVAVRVTIPDTERTAQSTRPVVITDND